MYSMQSGIVRIDIYLRSFTFSCLVLSCLSVLRYVVLDLVPTLISQIKKFWADYILRNGCVSEGL